MEEPRTAVSAGDHVHPPELSRLDEPYLVPWGLREMCVSSVLCGIGAAGVVALALLNSPWWALALVPLVIVWAFLMLFFRNPRRQIPGGVADVVSPADGVVWDVEELEETEFINGPAVRIGVFLSIFDVHVNRSPVRARVQWTRYRRGVFHDARKRAAATENESCSIALEMRVEGQDGGLPLLVRQISGAIARRIVCPLEPGMELERGGLIGMIKYGSRTELWVPRDSGFVTLVSQGDHVYGGASILGRFDTAGAAER